MSVYRNEVLFSCSKISLTYGEQVILNEVDYTTHYGEKIGIVGRNGEGKSSFLKLICEREIPDAGDFTYKKGLRTDYLPQDFELDDDLSVYDNVLEGMQYISDILNEYESLPADSAKSGDLEEEITRLDAWNIKYKIEELLHSLNAPEPSANVATLSGGEKRRVALAKTLISQPDLLLLDEPTNHLDINAITWLEDFIKSYPGACLFITHDRAFLDRVTNKITEISQGKLYSYDGNYANYLRRKAERNEKDQAAETKRQSYLRREIDWIRRGPKARTTKAQFRVNKFHDLANQDAPEQEEEIDVIIPPALRLGNKGIIVEDISMSFGDNNLFSNFSFDFEPGSRIGLVGGNGVGKTTLLNILTDKQKPSSGRIERSKNAAFNYIDQERTVLDYEKTVLEEIGEGYDFVQLGEERITIWAYLKRFLFTDERIKTTIKYLSGGELAKLALAKSIKKGGNFLILDEPTNDLDLQSLRLLEEALNNFNGNVIIVSHDRYFLERVCSSVLVFNGNKEIEHHHSYDFASKVNFKKQVNKKEKIVKIKPVIETKIEKNKTRKLTWKEKKELDGMEDNIFSCEARIEEIETLYTDPNFFTEYGDKSIELEKEIVTLKKQVEELYSRWEELSEMND